MIDQAQSLETAGFVLNFLKREWPVRADLQGRDGGYLSLGLTIGQVLFVKKVRAVRPEKIRKYSSFALEKITRLASHPEHILASQSRNPTKNKWGGAVRSHKYLRGFSGLTEELDEIAMIGLALAHDDLTWDEVETLFKTFYPNLDKGFARAFKGMSETNFEYGHFL